jgi:hypothetical protein
VPVSGDPQKAQPQAADPRLVGRIAKQQSDPHDEQHDANYNGDEFQSEDPVVMTAVSLVGEPVLPPQPAPARSEVGVHTFNGCPIKNGNS